MSYNQLLDNNIILNSEVHEYLLKDDPSFKFVSVTTFLSQFFDKFDAEKVATRLVSTSPKYMHMTVEELLGQWKKAGEHGTKVHNEIEQFLLDKTPVSEIKAVNGIKWLESYTYGKKCTVLTEAIVFSKELKLAGTIDLLIENEDKSYSIVDWKTNAKLTMSSFKNKKGIHPITSTLDDCKFTLYSLQLSLYRYILENYYGLKIKELIIAHLKDNEVKAYLTPYYNNHMHEFSLLRKEE